ncbi:MAG: carbon-nitrogen hydrolase family protein [Actinomycetota bacterium]|jgi:predicted amidohydrolase|nr:carbon-nitrogen hydrolase family protein [Pseudonocardiales bacterium]MDQ3599976.1 carbon-nitrogen hydrolase family protein [Actinomycetota bacterium]
METVDEFLIAERSYSDNESMLSVGLANIHAEVPDLEANKDKILRAASIFADRGVNVAVFPEFSLSGYFWDEHEDCLAYMKEAVTENQADWIESELQPLLGNGFEAILLNGLTAAEGKDRFLNRTFAVGRDPDYLADENTYDKVFLPGIEKDYTDSGRDDRLVLQTRHGRLGFTTCYDYLFSELLREYSMVEEVDAIVQIASWRAAGNRDYPGMNLRTDRYYGDLWDYVLPAASATNQVWTIACNAVGDHGVTGAPFWGGSGIWAPSGACLIQASHVREELVIVHNVDLKGAQESEKDDFDYAFDFKQIYRPLGDSGTFVRDLS